MTTIRIGLNSDQTRAISTAMVFHQRENLVIDIVVNGKKYDLEKVLQEYFPDDAKLELIFVNTTIFEERQNAKDC